MKILIRCFLLILVIPLLMNISFAQVLKIGPVGITVSNLDRSITFYQMLGFRKISETELEGSTYEKLEGIYGMHAKVARMQLGNEYIDLTDYLTSGGRSIPEDTRSNDLIFQHIAIVVSDMDKAYRLLRKNMVEYVSTEPQTLPASNKVAAGIRAFYFHDPDMHNIELIYFPKGKGQPKWQKVNGKLFLGIDHTAIGIRNTDSSLFFYQHLLGIPRIVMEKRLVPSIGPYFPIRSLDDFIILPTGLRLDADSRYTGKGVTICFIDSGFSLHPDLVQVKKRIKAFVDLTNPGKSAHTQVVENSDFAEPSSWHGTMTTVVCAGDGYLSNGLYKGLAPDAELVLLKVQDQEGEITTENIVKALEWIIENYKEQNIRIVNISLSDDQMGTYLESRVDLLAEALINLGITVVAAVGNDESGNILPPANAPNVIAVGGVDDGNQLKGETNKAYHSNYGKTLDDLLKPELVAHAIWIAAPILFHTKEKEEAENLHHLLSLPGALFLDKLEKTFYRTELDPSILQANDITFIKRAIKSRIQSAKYISPHYMHVDGTSFSAPIVCAVIAQLLEANPELTPYHIRQILFNTAKRMNGVPAERQGFGIVQPRKAILKVLRMELVDRLDSPFINRKKNTIQFSVHHDSAEHISLAGSFNQWEKDTLLLVPEKKGWWKIEIPILPEGRYSYKYFVDDQIWQEDRINPYREPDGYGGFNSLIKIEPLQISEHDH